MGKMRKKIKRKASRKLFTRTARRVHGKNSLKRNTVMRGGIRL